MKRYLPYVIGVALAFVSVAIYGAVRARRADGAMAERMNGHGNPETILEVDLEALARE